MQLKHLTVIALVVTFAGASVCPADPIEKKINTTANLIHLGPNNTIFIMQSGVEKGHAVGVPYQVTPSVYASLKRLLAKKKGLSGIKVTLGFKGGVITDFAAAS